VPDLVAYECRAGWISDHDEPPSLNTRFPPQGENGFELLDPEGRASWQAIGIEANELAGEGLGILEYDSIEYPSIGCDYVVLGGAGRGAGQALYRVVHRDPHLLAAGNRI